MIYQCGRTRSMSTYTKGYKQITKDDYGKSTHLEAAAPLADGNGNPGVLDLTVETPIIGLKKIHSSIKICYI